MRRCLFLVAMVLGLVSMAHGQSTQPTKQLKLTVIDAASGQPVDGATVIGEYATSRSDQAKSETATDAQGVADVTLAESRYVSVKVSKKGYVPMRLMWPAAGDRQSTTNPIPDAYTLKLEPGTKISGKVLDDAGQPVDAANVVLHIRKKMPSANERIEVVYQNLKTDAAGVWSYDRAPKEFDAISIGVHHPQYASEMENSSCYPMSDFDDHAKLRDGSAVHTLPRGVIVEGVVKDTDGKPVANAAIGLGSDRVPSNTLPTVKSDADGKYRMAVRGGMTVLTIKSKGHAPQLVTLQVGKEGLKHNFELTEGNVVRAQVVDQHGQPIEGASIYVDTWRGHRTLNHSMKTDKDGFFTWNEAPEDAVFVDVMKSGYGDKRKVPVGGGFGPGVKHRVIGDGKIAGAADAEDNVQKIQLLKPLVVRGKVVDAETGQPVESFVVVQGIWWSEDRPMHWQRRGAPSNKSRPGGTFEYEQSYPYPGYAVRIEADGYLPGDSRVFKMEEGKVDLEIKLTKGSGYKGVVRGPDGKPAKAKIVVATSETTAYVRNGKDIQDQGNIQADSGDDGAYTLPPMTGTFALVVFGDAGYAEVPAEQLAKSGDITLAAWGRIEGVAKIGSKPAAKAQISVVDVRGREMREPQIHHDVKAVADAEGRFTVERVRPGEVMVARTITQPMSGGMWSSSYARQTRTEVKSGETVTVALGGTGRPVVGRVTIPAALSARKDWQFGHSSIMSNTDFPKLEIPDEVKTMEPEQKKAWYEKWTKTEAGLVYMEKVKAAQAQHRSYPVVIQPDGSFRADEVDPGAYGLSITVNKQPDGPQCGYGDTLAIGNISFTVADLPGGRSDDPQDVGSVELKLEKIVSVGDIAPNITGKTLAGADFSLEQFKGKYVVVDFWATWCGPCVAEIPSMKSAYEQFARNEKFAMVSVSLDDKPETAAKFVEKKGMPWHQVFVPNAWESTAVKDYGVRGIPSVWLIGPDGKVLAKDLRGESLKQALAQHLR